MLSKNVNFIWFLGGPKFDLMTSLWRHWANLHKFLYSFEKTIRTYLSMPNFKSISFKMAVLQGAGRICPPHVCVIQKTPCGIGLKGHGAHSFYFASAPFVWQRNVKFYNFFCIFKGKKFRCAKLKGAQNTRIDRYLKSNSAKMRRGRAFVRVRDMANIHPQHKFQILQGLKSLKIETCPWI